MKTSQRPRPFHARLLWLVATAWVLSMLACGTTGEEEDDQKGGDHLPDDKVYNVAALPEGSGSVGLSRTEDPGVSFLSKFVHIADRYRVCLATADFSETELSHLTETLKVRSGDIDGYGLEGILNHALATVDRFKPDQGKGSSRLTIDVNWASSGLCHVTIAKAGAAEFPFIDDDFLSRDRVLLHVKQLRLEDGTQNLIPVIYVRETLTGPGLDIAVQFAIGRFIGLGKSGLAGSYLNESTAAGTPGRGWFIQNQDGTPRLDDDSQILYGYALLYRDILKVKDLGTYHYYEDQVHPRDAETDTGLKMPASPVIAPFTELPGNPHLTGVRSLGETLGVCFTNGGGQDLSSVDFADLLDFVNPATEGALMSYLHGAEPRLGSTAEVVEEGCGLLVEIRSGNQYPFADHNVNGLYAKEGSVKDGTGALSTLPVIYLNTDNLDFSPDGTGAGKPVKLVLKHEFAHFLGFRHSPSTKSVLSPAGYNEGWDLPGGDQDMIDEYVARWRELNPAP